MSFDIFRPHINCLHLKLFSCLTVVQRYLHHDFRFFFSEGKNGMCIFLRKLLVLGTRRIFGVRAEYQTWADSLCRDLVLFTPVCFLFVFGSLLQVDGLSAWNGRILWDWGLPHLMWVLKVISVALERQSLWLDLLDLRDFNAFEGNGIVLHVVVSMIISICKTITWMFCLDLRHIGLWRNDLYFGCGCCLFFSLLCDFPEVDVHLIFDTGPATALIFVFLLKRGAVFFIWLILLFGVGIIDEKRLFHLLILFLFSDHFIGHFCYLQMNIFCSRYQAVHIFLFPLSWLFYWSGLLDIRLNADPFSYLRNRLNGVLVLAFLFWCGNASLLVFFIRPQTGSTVCLIWFL